MLPEVLTASEAFQPAGINAQCIGCIWLSSPVIQRILQCCSCNAFCSWHKAKRRNSWQAFPVIIDVCSTRKLSVPPMSAALSPMSEWRIMYVFAHPCLFFSMYIICLFPAKYERLDVILVLIFYFSIFPIYGIYFLYIFGNF